MYSRPLLSNMVAAAVEWTVILLPVAVYLLFLALVINKKKRPVVVSGRVNFLWLLAALSGFLFIGPLSWLPHLYRPAGPASYWIGYGCHVLLVLAIGYWLVRRQHNTLVIYNIDPNDLAGALEEILTAMDVPHAVTPGRIALAEGNVVLDVEPSFLFNNVALRWLAGGSHELRGRIEENLRKALEQVDSGKNPGGTILLLAAIVILTFAVFSTALFLLT